MVHFKISPHHELAAKGSMLNVVRNTCKDVLVAQKSVLPRLLMAADCCCAMDMALTFHAWCNVIPCCKHQRLQVCYPDYVELPKKAVLREIMLNMLGIFWTACMLAKGCIVLAVFPALEAVASDPCYSGGPPITSIHTLKRL